MVKVKWKTRPSTMASILKRSSPWSLIVLRHRLHGVRKTDDYIGEINTALGDIFGALGRRLLSSHSARFLSRPQPLPYP
jgi:hypothetical protein